MRASVWLKWKGNCGGRKHATQWEKLGVHWASQGCHSGRIVWEGRTHRSWQPIECRDESIVEIKDLFGLRRMMLMLLTKEGKSRLAGKEEDSVFNMLSWGQSGTSMDKLRIINARIEFLSDNSVLVIYVWRSLNAYTEIHKK